MIAFFNNGFLIKVCTLFWGSPDDASGKDLPANIGDIRDTGLRRSPGEGHGNSVQYSLSMGFYPCKSP